MGHAKSSCKLYTIHIQLADGDMYGMWVQAYAYTVVSKGTFLIRMEIWRGVIFDTFTGEVNTNHKGTTKNGKDLSLSESRMAGERVEVAEPVEGRVNSGRIEKVAEDLEGVSDGPVQGFEKSELSHQSEQDLGLNTQIQNLLFDEESVGNLSPACKVGCRAVPTSLCPRHDEEAYGASQGVFR